LSNYNINFKSLKLSKKLRLLILIFFWIFLVSPAAKYEIGAISGIAIIMNYVVYILVSIWAFNLFFGKVKTTIRYEYRRIFNKILIPIILYIVVIGLQMIINSEKSSFIEFRQSYIITIPSISLVFISAYYTILSHKNYVYIIRLLYIMLLLIALYSTIVIGYSGNSSIAVDTGLYKQSNIYGYYLSLLLILTFAGVRGYIKIKFHKYAYYIILPIIIVFILRTGSYGAILVSLGSSIIFFYNPKGYTKTVLGTTFSIVVISVIIGITLIFSSNYIDNYKSNAFFGAVSKGDIEPAYEKSTFEKRYEIIIDGIYRIFEKPILGHGYSDRNGYSYSAGRNIPVHNAIVIESLKGGVLVAVIIGAVFLRLLSFVRKMGNSKLRSLSISMLLFIGIVDNTLTSFSMTTLNVGVIAFTILLSSIMCDMSLKEASFENKMANNIE
jgi:hypothetical protein